MQKKILLLFLLLLKLSANASAWTEVEKNLKRAVKQGDFNNGLGLLVFDRDHKLRFSYQYGDYSNEQAYPVLSASKWVSAATMMVLVDKGILKLDSKLSDFYPKAELSKRHAKIELRHLLSFTAGLTPQHRCFIDIQDTLSSCAQKILRQKLLDPNVGNSFNYGNASYSVAGSIAEIAAAKRWEQIFEQYLRKPLQLDPQTKYYAKPKKRIALLNPRLAGGLVISTVDYAKFLKMIFSLGRINDQQILSAKWIREMERDQFSAHTSIQNSFYLDKGLKYHYGFGLWKECSASGICNPALSFSPGLYGTFPWIDREKKYYAILGSYNRNSTVAAHTLVQRLRPLIEKNLLRKGKL